jgi:hypothetical protein
VVRVPVQRILFKASCVMPAQRWLGVAGRGRGHTCCCPRALQLLPGHCRRGPRVPAAASCIRSTLHPLHAVLQPWITCQHTPASSCCCFPSTPPGQIAPLLHGPDFLPVPAFSCSLYNNIKAPSQLQPMATYYLFKDGIEPKWEDPKNAHGGSWNCSAPRTQNGKQVLDSWWLHAVSVWSPVGEGGAGCMRSGESRCGVGASFVGWWLHAVSVGGPGFGLLGLESGCCFLGGSRQEGCEQTGLGCYRGVALDGWPSCILEVGVGWPPINSVPTWDNPCPGLCASSRSPSSSSAWHTASANPARHMSSLLDLTPLRRWQMGPALNLCVWFGWSAVHCAP